MEKGKVGFRFRNFLGGFFGGTLGIIMGWYIHSLVLPPAVLLGFTVGWYYREFLTIFKIARERARVKGDGILRTTEQVFVLLAKVFSLPSLIGHGAYALLTNMVHMITFVGRVLGRFRRWLMVHPMNRAIVIALLAFVAYCWGVSMLFRWAYLQTGWYVRDGGSGFAAIGLIVGVMGVFVYVVSYESSKSERMSKFYRSWSVISRYGCVGYAGYVLAMCVRYSAGIVLFILLAGGWMLSTFTLGVVGTLLFTSAVAVARGFYMFSCRKDHLPGLGITLCVTIASWILFHAHFENVPILWGVALATGCVCGVATEGLRRVLVPFYANTLPGHWVASRKVDADAYFDWIINKVVLVFFQQSRPARLLRAACFDRPVTLPVRVI